METKSVEQTEPEDSTGATSFTSGDYQYAQLLDLMREINQGASLERVFGLVVTALRQVFSFDRFALVLQQDDGTLRLTDGQGLSPSYRAVIQQRIGEGAGARALAERKPKLIADAPDNDEFWPFQQAARDEGFHTVLILPLFLGIDPLGYIIMYHDDIRTYTLEEVVLAQALAQQAAFAVQNARLLDATEEHRLELEQRFRQRVAEVAAIDEIVLQISSSLDLSSTLQSVVSAAATLSGSPRASIWLRAEGDLYRPVAAHGVPLERLHSVSMPGSTSLISRMKVTQMPVQVVDFSEEVHGSEDVRRQVEEWGTQSLLGVPLKYGGDILGALYVSGQKNESFSPETIDTLQRLSTFAQVALQNAQRFADVEAERSRLQAYIDAIPEGVIVFDRDERVMMFNETLTREWDIRTPMTGFLREDLFRLPERFSSRPLRFRFDPAAVFKRVLATGKPEQGLLEIENGSRLFEMHFSALRRDGEIEGIVSTIRDVTLPLELGRERSRSHLLAELLDLSGFLNSELSIPTLTERVVEVEMALIGARSGTLGLVEGDRLVFRRFHMPDGWVDFDIALEKGVGSPGHVWKTGLPYISNDCTTDPTVLNDIQQRFGFERIVTVPVLNRAGTIIGTLSAYDPVVERDFGQADVEAMQLLAHQAAIAIENARLSEVKDEFLSIVSHELKTPVTSIKGFAQVLKRRLSPESLERSGRYLDVINQQADRLTSLINDLLDLSRIQTGRFSVTLVPVRYDLLIQEVVSEMELVIAPERLQVAVPPITVVRGNAERLRQVLVNLIDNAVKHGPKGGTVHISVEEVAERIQTRVRDEGEGLPREEAERIFQPYYQVKGEALHQSKGLGLGLFISRQIVEEHGGTIWLDPDDQTSFCFTVPKG